MKLPFPAGTNAPPADEPGPSSSSGESSAAVTALYREHALGLVRLAYITLGNRAAAEDIVQEAFCGLYRRWDQLTAADKALAYLRSSVLNGCRNAYRQAGRPARVMHLRPEDSAEAAALIGEQRREVMPALRHLPLSLSDGLATPQAALAGPARRRRGCRRHRHAPARGQGPGGHGHLTRRNQDRHRG
jgi:hypothetical protein